MIDGSRCGSDKCCGAYKTSDKTYCLSCLHTGGYHIELSSWWNRLVYWFIGRKGGCMVGPWCKCRKYLPSDNLLYIQELSNRDNE